MSEGFAAADEAPPLVRLILDSSFGAERISFKSGEEIFADDAPATHLYLIASGQVRLGQKIPNDLARGDLGQADSTRADSTRADSTRADSTRADSTRADSTRADSTRADSTRLVDVLGPEEWFGIAVLAGASEYGVRAVAFTPSTVWRIAMDQLLAGFSARPEVLAAINRDVARCLVRAREEATRLIFEDCNQRLISTLIRLADTPASTPRDDGVVLHMTHSQLAQAVGAARETVSLGLTQLRNRNLLRTGRSQLFFKPEDLRRFRLQ